MVNIMNTNQKRWFDKFSSPEGAVEVVGFHITTEDDLKKFARWKERIANKYTLSAKK